MVEAAGIEPASEDLHPRRLHAYSPFFTAPSGPRRKGPVKGGARWFFVHRLRASAVAYPTLRRPFIPGGSGKSGRWPYAARA